MPRELVEKGSPADWLVYARSDPEVARSQKSEGILLETLCFHAQQAAEKAIKAVPIHYGIPTIKSHNIGALLNLLPESVSIPSDIWQSVILTDYAVVTRYPGDYEPVSDQEYKGSTAFCRIVATLVGKSDSKEELKSSFFCSFQVDHKYSASCPGMFVNYG
jgi:HEPN domain-containing protein